LNSKFGKKVMTANEAVKLFVCKDSVVGIGGQTTGRSSMVLAHEIVRQGISNLTLVGCSMSVSMDLIVGAGLANRTECGTGNVEMFGTTFAWRRAIEQGRLVSKDYSHLSMGLRFLAASLGIPFIPTKSMLGTDLLKHLSEIQSKDIVISEDPWDPSAPVVLLKALSPDVSIIHAQLADEIGNVVIEGFTTHDVEMAKASKRVIVSCEKLITSDEIRRTSDRTTIPYLYVDAVVEQPWGAYPTSCYRYYEHDSDHFRYYQGCAKEGGDRYEEYINLYIRSTRDFNQFLSKAATQDHLLNLQRSMKELL
jgi:acyl CoA:acetate/3-ketoacid CoA transferase alpha subunit